MNKSKTKELLECTVCWGDGKIDVDDDTRSESCPNCNGTGLISKNLKTLHN